MLGEGEVGDILVAKLDNIAHHDALLKLLPIGTTLGLEVDEGALLSQALGDEAKACLRGIEEVDVGDEG